MKNVFKIEDVVFIILNIFENFKCYLDLKVFLRYYGFFVKLQFFFVILFLFMRSFYYILSILDFCYFGCFGLEFYIKF